jgi:hypothetical protein
MKGQGILWRLVELLTRDVGRKIFALVFAVVLFDVLDKQVQADDTLSVPIRYVDERLLPETVDDPEAKQVLLIAERGTGGAKPLVVADADRPGSIILELHASKDALERAKSHRHRFVWRLGKEGAIEPTAEDFEGVDKLLEELGPGGRVVVPHLRFTIESEETIPLTLADTDLEFEGTPAPGYQLSQKTVRFSPPEIRLVGASSLIDEAKSNHASLFEKIRLDPQTVSISSQPLALKESWKKRRVRMLDAQGAPLEAVLVSIDFQKTMKPGDVFEVPVCVLYDDDRIKLRSSPDEPRSWADGWRIDFTKTPGVVPKVRLQILYPDDPAAPGPPKMDIQLAKATTFVVLRADEVTVNRQTAKVYITHVEPFPEKLKVEFAEHQDREFEVNWKAPTTAATDDKSKKAPGDH